MAKIEVGIGLRILIYFILLVIMSSTAFYFGNEFQRKQQLKAEIKVLSIDSEVVQKISHETKEKKLELESKIENLEKPIVDSNGYMSDEFMQLIHTAKSDAEQRGNKAGIIYRITSP